MKIEELMMEKVHQIGDKKEPRGAPERKARAFDGPTEHDRSHFRKGTGKWFVADHQDNVVDGGEAYIILLMRDDVEDDDSLAWDDASRYLGVSVLFRAGEEPQVVPYDEIARKQVKQDLPNLMKAANKALDELFPGSNLEDLIDKDDPAAAVVAAKLAKRTKGKSRADALGRESREFAREFGRNFALNKLNRDR